MKKEKKEKTRKNKEQATKRVFRFEKTKEKKANPPGPAESDPPQRWQIRLPRLSFP